MGDALFKRSYEPHMQGMWQMAGREIGTAANQDHTALLREAKHRFDSLMHQRPKGWMESKHLMEHIRQIRHTVLWHHAMEIAWQVMVFQDLFHEVAIEDSPWQLAVWTVQLHVFRQLLGNHMSA